jgi:5-formyltetrahydrofolate cyclo-ligase
VVFDPDTESFFRMQAKAALRTRLRALRNSIPDKARAARSQKIVERVLASAPFARAKVVALFWPMLERNEVDVRPIEAAAREKGKLVAYPSLQDEARMTLRLAESSSLEERGHGFAEPAEGASEAEASDELLVIVPALAIDPTGHRIGYGKGFYDNLLARICPPAFALGIAYDFEVVPEVPRAPHDRAVDLVITDLRSWQIPL